MASFPLLVLNSGSSSIKFSVYGTGDGEPSKLHDGAVDGTHRAISVRARG
jgi:acetate kinase